MTFTHIHEARAMHRRYSTLNVLNELSETVGRQPRDVRQAGGTAGAGARGAAHYKGARQGSRGSRWSWVMVTGGMSAGRQAARTGTAKPGRRTGTAGCWRVWTRASRRDMWAEDDEEAVQLRRGDGCAARVLDRRRGPRDARGGALSSGAMQADDLPR